MWCLLQECNARCFNGQEPSVVKLKYLFVKSFYEWTSLPTFSVEGFLDFLASLSFSIDVVSLFLLVSSFFLCPSMSHFIQPVYLGSTFS